MTPDDLLGLYSEAFKSIVNNDIRGEADAETAASLRDPRVVNLWYNSLVATKRSIETQFATFKIEKIQKKALADAGKFNYDVWMEDRNKWRTGALRFKSSVEEKIAEARGYLRSSVSEADTLRMAIVDHRVACLNDPDNAETHDELLWVRV